MLKRLSILALLAASFAATFPASAQEPGSADDDASSERVEESDESYRRRMELEDARHRDPGYTSPAGTRQKKQEKIDALPPASRDHIRDQLVDIILEDGEWEPMDALEEYPYEPSAAAQADDGLLKREQAAWDEQIDKYHEREAAAFGAQRSAAGAPGEVGAEADPEADPETDPEAHSKANSEGAGGKPGGAGSADGEAGQPGARASYSPYAADRRDAEDEPGTAGAQQSALDFLRGQQGGAARVPGQSDGMDEKSSAKAVSEAAANLASEAESETESEAESEAENPAAREIPGIIAIEDLDKLEGAEAADAADERDDSEPPG
jgi:hypothetical protein